MLSVCVYFLEVWLWYIYTIFIVYLSYVYSMFILCCSIEGVRVLRQFS